MTVAELIEVLRLHPPGTEVVMAIVAPGTDEDPAIETDLYTVDHTMLWPDDETGDDVLWLVGGEEEDVERLLDEVELEPEEDGDGHQH
jgi:hypothetical protein